jgi:uncharacterized membrane protein YcaP (DUF421 family)
MAEGVTMDALLGTTHNVNAAQECVRALIIFLYGLVMLRLSGRRTFARMSALDSVITIVAGSVLAQGMTGSVPIGPAMIGVAVLIALHALVSFAVARSDALSRLIEGEAVPLLREGVLDERKRIVCKISRSDLAEALREKGLDGLKDLHQAKKLQIEPSGKISVLKHNSG